MYFEVHPDAKISWLHYLTTGDMPKAAQALQMKAEKEKLVAERKV